MASESSDDISSFDDASDGAAPNRQRPLFCYASGRGGACTVTDAFVLSLKRVLGWVPLTRELPFVVPS